MLLVALLIGARTEWVTLSKADAPAVEDRAFAAVALGETRPDATSAELIDAAVIRGEISPEQGLLYGVYLACDANRLPAQFRGMDTGTAPRNILWEADVDWESLSAGTRQAFGDFFAAQWQAEGTACANEIGQLADEGDAWWIAALRSIPSNPDGAGITASRP
jgi:hypothetical protein